MALAAELYDIGEREALAIGQAQRGSVLGIMAAIAAQIAVGQLDSRMEVAGCAVPIRERAFGPGSRRVASHTGHADRRASNVATTGVELAQRRRVSQLDRMDRFGGRGLGFNAG